MRKLIMVALVAGFIGFLLGNAFWYLASPLWIDRVVSENLNTGAEAQVRTAGSFKDADGSHKGSGQVTVVEENGQTTIRFTEFQVTNGPDLYVWLSKDAAPADSAAVKAVEHLELGVLKGNIGDQNYSLPEGANIDDWGSVTIWCRQFGVLFASASLK